MGRISAVITTYNSVHSIGKCLDALKWVDEILVIDSQSNDGTLEICSRYPNVRVIQNASVYPNVKRNQGYEEAQGGWIIALDSY